METHKPTPAFIFMPSVSSVVYSLLIVSTSTILFFSQVSAKVILPPSQIVLLWIQFYPHDLVQAATLTTVNMRDGLSPEEWAEGEQHTLTTLQLRYLGGKVDSEVITGNKAVVIFRAHTMTRIGEHTQIERYRLIKQLDGGWLIDEVEVVEAHILGSVGQ